MTTRHSESQFLFRAPASAESGNAFENDQRKVSTFTLFGLGRKSASVKNNTNTKFCGRFPGFTGGFLVQLNGQEIWLVIGLYSKR